MTDRAEWEDEGYVMKYRRDKRALAYTQENIDAIIKDAQRWAAWKGYWTGFFWGALTACALGTVAILIVG